MQRVKVGYLVCAVTVLAYTLAQMLAIDITMFEATDALSLVYAEGGLVAIGVLTLLSLSFIYSFCLMKRVASQATLGFSKPVLLLNIFLVTMLIVSEMWFVVSLQVQNMSAIYSNLATEVCRLLLKIILLRLAQSFGLAVTVRSFVNTQQELVIVGVDRTGAEQFRFLIRPPLSAGDNPQDHNVTVSDLDCDVDGDVSYIE